MLCAILLASTLLLLQMFRNELLLRYAATGIDMAILYASQVDYLRRKIETFSRLQYPDRIYHSCLWPDDYSQDKRFCLKFLRLSENS